MFYFANIIIYAFIFMLLFVKNECHLKLSNVVGYVVIFVFFFKNEQDLKLRNVVGVENPV